MSDSSAHPHVYVAVALIKRESDILLAYNPRWGSYSLPMSKLREWEDPRQKDGKQTRIVGGRRSEGGW